jgi:hypothetical protein
LRRIARRFTARTSTTNGHDVSLLCSPRLRTSDITAIDSSRVPLRCVLDTLSYLGPRTPLIIDSHCAGAQILDPIPICHLQPRTTLPPQIDRRLHSLLLYCTLEPAQLDLASSMIDPLDALIGASVVGPTFESQSEDGAAPKACFIFRDLSMRTVEGLYRLRFTLFETVE